MSYFMYFGLRKIKILYEELINKKSVRENILIQYVFGNH